MNTIPAPGGDRHRFVVTAAAIQFNRELTIDRLIKAPREKVWAARTDPRQLAQW
jgi:hypothetical protein